MVIRVRVSLSIYKGVLCAREAEKKLVNLDLPQVRRGSFSPAFSCNLPPPLIEFEFPTCIHKTTNRFMNLN
jgi:hypothetical protein